MFLHPRPPWRVGRAPWRRSCDRWERRAAEGSGGRRRDDGTCKTDHWNPGRGGDELWTTSVCGSLPSQRTMLHQEAAYHGGDATVWNYGLVGVESHRVCSNGGSETVLGTRGVPYDCHVSIDRCPRTECASWRAPRGVMHSHAAFQQFLALPHGCGQYLIVCGTPPSPAQYPVASWVMLFCNMGQCLWCSILAYRPSNGSF